MAKVGYIFKADLYEGFDADKEWMQQYGCIQIVEESVEHESLRPQWKQLISKLERGDEIVVPKFSNAVRGSRELASFIEFCRIKVVRIISIHDRIDSMGKMFPETTAVDVLNMLGGTCRRGNGAAQLVRPCHAAATEHTDANKDGKGHGAERPGEYHRGHV